jgi:hypothetical protein
MSCDAGKEPVLGVRSHIVGDVARADPDPHVFKSRQVLRHGNVSRGDVLFLDLAL